MQRQVTGTGRGFPTGLGADPISILVPGVLRPAPHGDPVTAPADARLATGLRWMEGPSLTPSPCVLGPWEGEGPFPGMAA